MLGYELNILNMSDEIKRDIAAQIAQYREFEHVTRTGDYYSLAHPTKYPYSAYYYATDDASEILFSVIEKADCKQGSTKLLKIKTAKSDAVYTDVLSGKSYRGEELRAGLRIGLIGGGDRAHLFYFKQMEP
jgi:alpha-galactosidase